MTGNEFLHFIYCLSLAMIAFGVISGVVAYLIIRCIEKWNE